MNTNLALPVTKYACWSAEDDDVSVVTMIASCDHESAAVSFVMAAQAGYPVQRNHPSAEKIGVVHLETGDCRFVWVKLSHEITDRHAAASDVESKSALEAAP